MDPQVNPFANAPQPSSAPDNNQNQPVAPAPNPAPVAMPVAPVATPTDPNAPKKSHLGLILGLSIGGGVLLIGVLILVLVLVFGGVSRQDYRDAVDQTQKIANLASEDGSYATSIDSILSGTPDQSAATNAANKIKAFQSDLKTEMGVLSSMKAVTRDSDAKTKFDKLQATYQKYDQDLTFAAKLLNEAGPVFAGIAQLSDDYGTISYTDLSSFGAVATDAHTIATACGNVNTGNSDVDNAFQTMGDAYENFATVLDKVVAGDTSATSSLSSASSKLSSAATALSTAMKSVSATDDSSDFTDAVNDLGKYLTAKANGQN